MTACEALHLVSREEKSCNKVTHEKKSRAAVLVQRLDSRERESLAKEGGSRSQCRTRVSARACVLAPSRPSDQEARTAWNANPSLPSLSCRRR